MACEHTMIYITKSSDGMAPYNMCSRCGERVFHPKPPTLVSWIKRALIYIDHCVGAGEIHFPGIEDDPADLAVTGFALFGLEEECDAAAIPDAKLLTPDIDCVSLLADLDAGKPVGAEAAATLRAIIIERDDLAARVKNIGDFAHDRSSGPTVPDDLWEVRSMAYDL